MSTLQSAGIGCDPKLATCASPAALKMSTAIAALQLGQAPDPSLTGGKTLEAALFSAVDVATASRERLDQRLAAATGMARGDLLDDCVSLSPATGADKASYCAEVAWKDAQENADAGPAAVKIGMRMAARAASEGHVDAMHAWLDRALELAQGMDAKAQWAESDDLRAVAIAELREEGRL